jgi:hypothetical protein
VLARSIELLGGTQTVEELALRAGVAELKAADAIFTEPEHWYTRSLVDSALALRQLRG